MKEQKLMNNRLSSVKYEVSSYYVKFQYILCMLIAIFTMIGDTEVTSMLLSLTFIVLIINFIDYFVNCKYDKSAYKDGILFIIIAAAALLAIIYVTDYISLNYLKKYIMFCSTLIFLFIVGRVTVNKELVEFILKVNFIIFLAYFFFYRYGNAPYIAGGLTMNFTNPNLLALWLLHAVLYSIISLIYYKSRFIKLIFSGTIAILLFMIYATRTRSVMTALIMFIGFYIFLTLNKHFKFNKLTVGFMVIYPLIFAALYLLMIGNPVIITVLDFLTSQGKVLEARVGVWDNALSVINNNLWLGNYYVISGGTGMSQLHNTHIDIIASYGIPVFILFIIYLYKIVYRIAHPCEIKFQKIAVVSFFTILVAGSAEAALVSGSVGMYILSCSLLLIARYKPFQTNIG